MDWIERLLHINPDNGSGSMEFMIALAVALLVAAPTLRWYRARQHRR